MTLMFFCQINTDESPCNTVLYDWSVLKHHSIKMMSARSVNRAAAINMNKHKGKH